jgi:hypothetical protein
MWPFDERTHHAVIYDDHTHAPDDHATGYVGLAARIRADKSAAFPHFFICSAARRVSGQLRPKTSGAKSQRRRSGVDLYVERQTAGRLGTFL